MKNLILAITTTSLISNAAFAQTGISYSEKVSKANSCVELNAIKASMNKSYGDIRKTSNSLIKLDQLLTDSKALENKKDGAVKGVAYATPMAIGTIIMTLSSLNHKGSDFGDSEWRGTKYLMGFFALTSTALSAFGIFGLVKNAKKSDEMKAQIQKLKVEEAVLLKDLNDAKQLLNNKAAQLYCQI